MVGFRRLVSSPAVEAAVKQFDMSRISVDPFGSKLGIRPVKVAHGSSLVAVEIDERHMNSNGYVNGSVSFALADAAMGLAIATDMLNRKTSSATLEMKLNFLRAAKGGRLEAEAKVIRITERFAMAEATIRSGEHEVARALGTFAILPLTEHVRSSLKRAREQKPG